MASGRQPDVKMEQYEDQLKDDYDNQDLEELDHQEEEIISEELVHEDMLGDGVQIEYVEEGDLAVGEVILDGNGEVMEDEMATQSLVALSRGAKDQRKGMRTEYVQHVAVQKSSPRILRRPAMPQRGFVYEQGTSRQQAPVVKPNFPVPAQTKRLLPVATLPAKNHGNWREEQKRQLEVYEIYDVLPDHMRNTFRTILDSKGQKLPVRTKPNPVRRGGRDFGDVPPETADRIYKESESLDEQHRQMDKKDIDSAEYTDMPQLEEAADDSQNGGEAQIDVEHLDSNDDGQIAMQYIMDDDTELVEMDYREQDKMNHREQVIMQDIREEYYADSNGYQQNQMVMPNCYTDTRYCPGCKLHLKRSIYYHHSRMIKKYGICNMFTPKRFPCSVPGCDEKLGTVEKLCEHMHQIHNAPTDIKTEVFESKETFGAFLQELEAKGGNFRMSRGNKMIKTGMVQYFRCNRTQAMAKDKTMRICDEVGLYGEPVESGYVQRPEDPFANRITGGKPQLRTEDACTAFYRKAFLPNGQIEVRYCDHHLHEDERLRLPQQVKERIYDMHRKKLQPTVILMVLKEERQQFALPGSAVERKILCLTPKDISAVISTRNSNARKRNKARESGKNIAADCDELSFDESAILTETERRCLEQYMNNESTILRDMAEIKRVENRRRHLRETIRNNVFQLGRYIRTSPFAELPIDMLEKICENVKTAATLTRMKSNEPGMGAKSSDAGDPYMMRHAEMQEMDNNQYDDPSVTVDGTVDAIDDSYLTAMEHEQSTSMHMHEEHEEQVMDNSGHMEDQEQIIVDQEPEMEPPAKKKRGRKPKSLVPVEVVAPAPDRRVKEENVDYDQDSVNLPSRTRTGRVVRPSHKLMDM